MNPEAQEVLNKILTKEVHELTVHDKAFLRARAQYIGRNSRKKFQEVLTEKVEEPKNEENTPSDDDGEVEK